MLKNTPIISVYNYNNEKQTDIYTNDISVTYEYGSVSTLNFRVPYYHYDADENLIFKDNKEKAINPKINYLINENIVLFDNNYYLIKNTRKSRKNTLYFEVECIGFATQLSYKTIGYLSTKPPETNPLKISSNILYTLIARDEKTRGIVTSFTSNTITLDGGLPAGTDVVAGDYIAVIDGVGQGYNYEIASSLDDTVTINGTLEEALQDNKSLCVIHDSNYTIGNVDSSFIVDDEFGDIYRSFLFQGTSVMSALNEIANRMDGHLTFNTIYDDFYGSFICEVGLEIPKETYENVEFRYNKNLDSVTRELDTIENIYTVLYPYGDDGLRINSIPDKSRTDSGVTYLEHTEGLPYIENYQYFLSLGYSLEFCKKNFFNDLEVENTLYVDSDDLYRDHQKMLENISKPKTTYTISGTDLSFFDGYDYTKFSVGDKIRVYDSELGVSIFANVIRKTIDYTKPHVVNIEISNIVDDFSDYFVERLKNLKEYTNDKTNENEASYQNSNYNLLNNGGCELSLNKQDEVRFWILDNLSLTTTPEDEDSISGSKSFKLTDSSGTSGSGSLYQVINNVASEKPYTASCTLLANNCEAELVIEELDETDSIIETHTQTYKPLFFVQQDLSLTFTTSVDCVKLFYKVKKYNSVDNNPSDVIFDNCKLETGEKKTPYIEIASDLEYYDNNMVYYGVEMNEAVGLVIEREDKLARAQFNADKFVMQTGDGNGNYTDSLRFDPNEQEYIFNGKLEAGDIVGSTITATDITGGTLTANTIIGSTLEIDSNSGGSIDIGNGNFTVNSDGELIAQQATLFGDFLVKDGAYVVSELCKDSNGGLLKINQNNGVRGVILGTSPTDNSYSYRGGLLRMFDENNQQFLASGVFYQGSTFPGRFDILSLSPRDFESETGSYYGITISAFRDELTYSDDIYLIQLKHPNHTTYITSSFVKSNQVHADNYFTHNNQDGITKTIVVDGQTIEISGGIIVDHY